MNDDMNDPDLAEHVRAVSLRRDELIAEATALQADTWRRLEAAGISRLIADAVARSLGPPPREIPFSAILEALASQLDRQASTARDLASEWRAWDRRVEGLEEDGDARVLALETEGTLPC